jgi:glyoxylase-like metal-dependent hydrolase (beta-lactamase superfamily II)
MIESYRINGALIARMTPRPIAVAGEDGLTMGVEVYPLRLGLTRCYVIRDRGAILVDAGMPWQAGSFIRQLARTPVNPAEIRLIVLSHGHFDHAGSAAAIQRLTGAELAAHIADVDIVEGSRITKPTPQTRWGATMWSALAPFMPALAARYSAHVDLTIGDDGRPLSDYGIAGRIVHTPGHTAGSLSVLLETGQAFVGCMAHSGPPFRAHPDLPIFADDPDQLRRSWEELIALGAQHVYPGHGDPFDLAAILSPLAHKEWGRG